MAVHILSSIRHVSAAGPSSGISNKNIQRKLCLKPVLKTKSHSFTYKYWVLYKIVILNEVWLKNLHFILET